MGISRYNSPRVYTFDPGGRNSLEPVVGNFTDYMTNLPGSRMTTVAQMLRSAAPGGYSNAMFTQPTANPAAQANFTFFGVPTSAELSEYANTYFTGRLGAPTMPKQVTNSVYATFILAMPTVSSTTSSTAPVLNAGLSNVTSGTATNSYVNLNYNGTHTSTTFNMGLNMFGPNGAQTTGFITASTEYACWVSITPAGLMSASIGGLTLAPIQMTATVGNFWVAIGGGSTITTSSAGIRQMRVVIA